MAFALKVLSSTIFWIFFFVIGFIIGSKMIKEFAPNTFRYLTTGKRGYNLFIFEVFLICLFIYLFWPIILAVVIFLFVVKKIYEVTFPIFGKGVDKASKIIPDFEIKKR